VKEKKSANMVINETGGGTSGCGNPLPYVLSVCNSPEWWMDSGANIHVCADIYLFASFQVGRTGELLMGNRSRVHVHSVGSVIMKFTSGKTVLLKHVQHVPSIKKNLVSISLLCRDGYKVVFESNKCVVSRHGTFVGKGYDCGGLFRLSLMDVCNNIVNSVSICDETDLRHSRLCHVNFGCLMRLANMSLIPKFNHVKGSKCDRTAQFTSALSPKPLLWVNKQ
jgi:histone deacetylase 1/2